jgi:hypothetical protein
MERQNIKINFRKMISIAHKVSIELQNIENMIINNLISFISINVMLIFDGAF